MSPPLLRVRLMVRPSWTEALNRADQPGRLTTCHSPPTRSADLPTTDKFDKSEMTNSTNGSLDKPLLYRAAPRGAPPPRAAQAARKRAPATRALWAVPHLRAGALGRGASPACGSCVVSLHPPLRAPLCTRARAMVTPSPRPCCSPASPPVRPRRLGSLPAGGTRRSGGARRRAQPSGFLAVPSCAAAARPPLCSLCRTLLT
jgi:hypothetical protein